MIPVKCAVTSRGSVKTVRVGLCPRPLLLISQISFPSPIQLCVWFNLYYLNKTIFPESVLLGKCQLLWTQKQGAVRDKGLCLTLSPGMITVVVTLVKAK